MKPITYKAAIYRGIGSVEVIELDYPECGDDDIIVKNLMATVCGGDIGAYKYGGDASNIWKDHEFGHEMVSEVVEIGKNVKGLKLGDHVFPNMEKAKRDFKRIATVGGFSEYIHIPQCEAGYSVMIIPNDMPLKAATLLEPFVIGTRGVKGLDPQPGMSATVFGAGAIGMSAAIMLKWYGCEKVMIVDISDKRLEKAAQFGLATCNSEKENLKAKAFETFGSTPDITGGEFCACDLYLDAVGIQAALDGFQSLAKRFARLAVVGVHHAPGVFDMVNLCFSNWLIQGCGYATLEDLFPEIIRMIQSGQYDISTMISHEYKLYDIEKALRMAANSTDALKVAIRY
jgi:threonine dehydrogenase-like Zn-dependent dehydrogenase